MLHKKLITLFLCLVFIGQTFAQTTTRTDKVSILAKMLVLRGIFGDKLEIAPE